MRTSQLWKYFSIWGVLLCHTCSLPTESSYSPTLPGQATQEETSFILLKSKICKEETSSIFYMKALFNPVMCREETASGTYETLQSRYSNVREAQDLVHQTSTTSSAYLAHQPNNTGSAYPPSQDLDPQVTNSSYAPSQDLTHQSNNTSSAYLPSQDLQHKLSYASHAYKPIQNTIKRTFGNFSFGIGFSKNSSRMSRAEVLKSVDTQLSEQLFLNVMVEGSPGDTELIVHSCQLMDRRNTSIGAYIIQEGCLSDKTAEEVVLGNSKEKIYSLRLSSLPTASEIIMNGGIRQSLTVQIHPLNTSFSSQEQGEQPVACH
uniref:Uncharacterized protein LOC117352094 isoform X2 n=1 Tax=Geotrypetes seraphini TaxID=260995 RepID=A0A6P8PJP5_GEOSA|nr:uncharacterized protein LOC117352094 isoform X2 [Geotrypetes seraphini]